MKTESRSSNRLGAKNLNVLPASEWATAGTGGRTEGRRPLGQAAMEDRPLHLFPASGGIPSEYFSFWSRRTFRSVSRERKRLTGSVSCFGWRCRDRRTRFPLPALVVGRWVFRAITRASPMLLRIFIMNVIIIATFLVSISLRRVTHQRRISSRLNAVLFRLLLLEQHLFVREKGDRHLLVRQFLFGIIRREVCIQDLGCWIKGLLNQFLESEERLAGRIFRRRLAFFGRFFGFRRFSRVGGRFRRDGFRCPPAGALVIEMAVFCIVTQGMALVITSREILYGFGGVWTGVKFVAGRSLRRDFHPLQFEQFADGKRLFASFACLPPPAMASFSDAAEDVFLVVCVLDHVIWQFFQGSKSFIAHFAGQDCIDLSLGQLVLWRAPWYDLLLADDIRVVLSYTHMSRHLIQRLEGLSAPHACYADRVHTVTRLLRHVFTRIQHVSSETFVPSTHGRLRFGKEDHLSQSVVIIPHSKLWWWIGTRWSREERE